MRLPLLVLAAMPAALAFPSFAKEAANGVLSSRMEVAGKILEARAVATKGKKPKPSPKPGSPGAIALSKARDNCGPTPCLTFNAEDQYVSTTGEYAYQSPAVSDIRGPCPGLNAAANHGYLPRSGIVSLEETVSGLGALYNMSPELAAALAAYAIAIDGNVAEGVWSIGGPLPADLLTGAVLGTGQGLSYSHNNYEGDGSIGRNDAYLDNGDAHSLNVTHFAEAYAATAGKTGLYTLDSFASHYVSRQDSSIANNGYYFTGAFSTVVVVPIAYNFVINFMSNHSAAVPGGYLNGYNFKSFFAVTGKPGNFKWLRGQERVPDNWYRRPSDNQYTGNDVFEDQAINYLAYPSSLKFGGNTGKPNTFVGVNPEDLSGGAYNASSLFQSDNLACFSYNLLEQGLPNFLDVAITDLQPLTELISNYTKPAFTNGLNCPQISQYNYGLFNQFPGYKYSPTGPDTNYKN